MSFRNAVGLKLEALGLPFREAVGAAGQLGVAGVRFDAVGSLAPDELSQTGRRQVAHLIRSHRLSLIGLGCPTRRGYDSLERLDARIDQTRKTLRLAADLRAPFVSNHVGRIPSDRESRQGIAFYEALRSISQEADRVGARFAIHVSGDSPAQLAELLKDSATFGMGVDYDPANALVAGSNCYEGVAPLAGSIVGVRIKDVVRTAASVSGFREAMFGDGEIEWDQLFGALAGVDYQGAWTLAPEATIREMEVWRRALSRLAAYG